MVLPCPLCNHPRTDAQEPCRACDWTPRTLKRLGIMHEATERVAAPGTTSDPAQGTAAYACPGCGAGRSATSASCTACGWRPQPKVTLAERRQAEADRLRAIVAASEAERLAPQTIDRPDFGTWLKLLALDPFAVGWRGAAAITLAALTLFGIILLAGDVFHQFAGDGVAQAHYRGRRGTAALMVIPAAVAAGLVFLAAASVLHQSLPRRITIRNRFLWSFAYVMALSLGSVAVIILKLMKIL